MKKTKVAPVTPDKDLEALHAELKELFDQLGIPPVLRSADRQPGYFIAHLGSERQIR